MIIEKLKATNKIWQLEDLNIFILRAGEIFQMFLSAL